MRRLTFLLVLLIPLQWLPTSAQTPYHIEFNTENGLPSSEVYDVEFDHQGRAWFPTDRGLCVYNGYEFKVYTTKEGLPNNCVLEIRRGPNGELWFLTLDGKLSYLEKDNIVQFAGNDLIAEINKGNWLIREEREMST